MVNACIKLDPTFFAIEPNHSASCKQFVFPQLPSNEIGEYERDVLQPEHSEAEQGGGFYKH